MLDRNQKFLNKLKADFMSRLKYFNGNALKYLFDLGRNNLRTILGVLTGHNHLQYHLKNLNMTDTPNCRGYGTDLEMAKHFLCWC